MNVLCVCTGNICRSPMLEYLLRQELEKRGLTHITVTSAGTDTIDDMPASEHAVTVMDEVGIDLTVHRSRQMTQAIADDTDVCVVMTPQHGVIAALYFGIDPEAIVIPGEGIPDPFGGSVKQYRQCRDALAAALDQVIEEIESR